MKFNFLNLRNSLIIACLCLCNTAIAQYDTFAGSIKDEIQNSSSITGGGRKGYGIYLAAGFDLKANKDDKYYNLFKFNYVKINDLINNIYSIGLIYNNKDISYCFRLGKGLEIFYYNPLSDVIGRSFFTTFLLNANLSYTTDFKSNSFVFIPEIGFSNKRISLSSKKQCFLTFNVLFGFNIPFSKDDYLYNRKSTPCLSVELLIKGIEFWWDSFDDIKSVGNTRNK